MSHHRRLLIQTATTIAVLLIGYAASSGPVLRMVSQNRFSQETAELLYRPLLGHWSDPCVQGPYRAYLSLWGVGVLRFHVGPSAWLVFLPEEP